MNGWHRRWQQRAWSTVEAVRAKLTHTVLRALAAVVALAIAPVRCAVAHAQTGGNARPAIRAVAAEWTRRVLGAVATIFANTITPVPTTAIVVACNVRGVKGRGWGRRQWARRRRRWPWWCGRHRHANSAVEAVGAELAHTVF